MAEHIDVRTRLAAAERAVEIAETGWADYIGPGPGRYAGLTTAIRVGRSIPQLLRALRGDVSGWDEWWDDTAPWHDSPDAAWLGKLRVALDRPGVDAGTREDHLDATFSRELMRRAPRGTVSWFLNDDVGRSGWKVKLPDGTLEDVFFTIPVPVARAYAALATTPDGRGIDQVLPGYLRSMRALVAAARARFDA